MKMIYFKIVVLVTLTLSSLCDLYAQPNTTIYNYLHVKFKLTDNQGKKIKLLYYTELTNEKIYDNNGNKMFMPPKYNNMSFQNIDTSLITTSDSNKSIYIVYDTPNRYNFCNTNKHSFIYNKGEASGVCLQGFSFPVIRYHKNKIDIMMVVLKIKGCYQSYPKFLCNLSFQPGITYIDFDSPRIRSKMQSGVRIGRINISPDNYHDYVLNGDLFSYYDNMMSSKGVFKFFRKHKYTPHCGKHFFNLKLLDKEGKEILFNTNNTDLGMVSYDSIYHIDFSKYSKKCKKSLTLISKDSCYVISFFPIDDNRCLITGVLNDSVKNIPKLLHVSKRRPELIDSLQSLSGLIFNWCPTFNYFIHIKHITINGSEEMNILGSVTSHEFSPFFIPFISGNYFLNQRAFYGLKEVRDFHPDKTNMSFHHYKEVFINEFKL